MSFIFVIPISLTLSCQNNNSTSVSDCSYKIFSTLDKEFSSFKFKNQPNITFEYPGCYVFTYPGTPREKNTMRFDFIKNFGDYLTNSAIQVSIQRLESANTVLSVSEAIDIFIEDTRNYKYFDNFSIIERKSILVNTMEGESAIVLVHRKEKTDYPAMDELIKQVVFEKKGYLWKIQFYCNNKDISQNMPGFDRVLNTFKIMD
jgi:hypothetical protein